MIQSEGGVVKVKLMIHVAVLLHGTPVRIQNKGNIVAYVWLDSLNGLAQDSILVIFFEIDGI